MASGYFLYEDEEVIKHKINVSDMKPSQSLQYNVVVDQLGNKLPKKKSTKIVETISFAVKRYEWSSFSKNNFFPKMKGDLIRIHDDLCILGASAWESMV